MTANGRDVSPPDLEMRVRTTTSSGRTGLIYVLHSPAGRVPFAHLEIEGPVFQGSPEDLHRRFLQQIEDLGTGLDVDRGLVLRPEVRRKLDGLGRRLWQELFGGEMRQAYRRFRDAVRTFQIISDEPWIPWEMIKPYDDQGDILDDEFFAERFELTRWLAGERISPGEIEIRAYASLGQTGSLPQTGRERDLVNELFGRQAGLRNVIPSPADVGTLLTSLEAGGVGLVHYAGHGTFDPALPNEAGLSFPDGSVFRPSDLHGRVQTQLARDRPLVFLNACRSGRQDWSWTSLGGWADRWIRFCGCGAFIGTQWNVRDSVALTFAQTFFQSLVQGETLGAAAKAARQAARNAAPGDPGWLAYSVYGHPNARILLGQEAISAAAQEPYVPLKKPPLFEIFAQPDQSATDVPPASSSNLRIKQSFTDRDRDQFVEKSFGGIAALFESSLEELQKKYPSIETSFRRIDQRRFVAAVYVAGKKEASCRIWMDRGHLGDIAYASGDSGPDNTYNETLSVMDDGYSLSFRPLGLRFFGSSERKPLSPHEAAEYLWSMLIERLQ